MQKKLLTMAVASALAMPAVALAQVTVYGSIDTGIKQQSKIFTGVGVETDSKLSVDSQIKKSNRWGLKGSDDLGGGLMANFTLEGAFNSDDGTDGSASGLTSLFNRRAIVGLSSGGNSVNLGREYTLNFKTQGIYDPLSHDYGVSAGIQGGVGTAGTRTNNSVTGEFRFGPGGVGVQYGMGEVLGEISWDTYTAFNGDLAFGPVTVGAAFSSRDNATGTASTDTTNVGAAYKMGAFTFRFGLGMEERESVDESQKISGGVQYDFSPTLTGRVSLYDLTVDDAAGEAGTARTIVVNVEYSLSKRTLLYGVVDSKKLTGNQLTSLADGATGIGAGIVHNF